VAPATLQRWVFAIEAMSERMTGSKALAEASMQAQLLHARLRTDFDRPIDVFWVVQQEGIWLASRPLGRGLYGFYLREGEATGIVVHAEHPEYLQRYTCAHELGHHLLGHSSRLDEEPDIIGNATSDRYDEIAAQVFAGNFLMPLQAVNRAQRRLGIRRNQTLGPAEVYAISRELDVSFTATAWQLVNLRRLTSRQASEVVRSGAAAAKRTIRGGPHPDGDNRAGLVIIGESGRDVPVLCRPGDEVRVRLPENASTGHVWQIQSPAASDQHQPNLTWDGDSDVTLLAGTSQSGDVQGVGSALRLVDDLYRAGRQDRGAQLGHTGQRELVFLAVHPGRENLVLSHRRPWESGEVDVLTTRVYVGHHHELDGFADAQVRGHVTRVAQRGAP
jgi:Zn-dependent peptidase ImmA (M78 family)/predicted secreted protein